MIEIKTKLPKFLSVSQVAARIGVSANSIWKWSALGTFPSPVKLNLNTTRWVTHEVIEWEKEKINNCRYSKDECDTESDGDQNERN